MGDLCFRALRGLAEAFPGTVLLFSCSLCSILHPFPPHTVTVILHTKFLLCVCFWKTSLRQGAYRNDLQAIMSSPSFSLNMSQQIVQPAKSSGGVNDGKHDIYVSPCLLPGSAFFFFFFFLFYFIFKLYITVLDLPNIKMNPPQVYMCSPS